MKEDSNDKDVFKPATTVGTWSLIPLGELWDQLKTFASSCPTQRVRELGPL